eukprot:4861118-Prymnesium_polylepis.1
MPNALLSNHCARRTNEPRLTQRRCVASTTSSSMTEWSQRDEGTPVTASPPASSARHKLGSSSQSPGQRKSNPSKSGAALPDHQASRERRPWWTAHSSSGERRRRACEAMARGVGCSRSSVGESTTPIRSASCEESCVAPMESTPASINAQSSEMEPSAADL